MKTSQNVLIGPFSEGKDLCPFAYLRIKVIFTFFLFLFTTQLFGQSKKEAEILKISKDLFRWEIEGKIDSLANLFDEKLIIIGSKGKRSKSDLLSDLKNGKPVHNSINVEEATATIVDATAIVVGKGVFVTSMNDSKTTSHLSYIEVYVQKNKGWKLIALYANRLPD